MNSPKFPSVMQDNIDTFKAVSKHLRQFKGLMHEEVWLDFITTPSEKLKEKALEELLFRQNGLLSNIAKYIYRNNRDTAEQRDFMEICRILAISAYERYNPELGIKLNTFIGTSVSRNILGQSNVLKFIKCKAGKRELRKYFRGDYIETNPEMILKLEEKYAKSFTDEKKLQKMKHQCQTINAEIISYESYITTDNGQIVEKKFDNLYLSENDGSILDKIAWQNVVEGLSGELQKDIYTMRFLQQYTVKEVAAELRMTEVEVKREIELIKKKFRSELPEYLESVA
jgi:RNA polymerase sigma factor (sigma-70 family)